MQNRLVIAASITFAGTAALVGQLTAGPTFSPASKPGAIGSFSSQPIAGPDVICGDVNGIHNWGGASGLGVYSLGTTSCNIGDAILLWQQFTNQHPVMPQNIYRIETVDGATRIEQIGQSWLKHGFCALQQFLCGACTPVPGGCASALGVGCSDPYTPQRNGTQGNMGPRYDINASTGVFTYPLSYIGATAGIGLQGKRIQVATPDLNLALHPGAEYWGECQYVHPQDAGSDNNDNNASRRKLNVGALQGVAPNQYYQLSVSGPTVQKECALFAWKAADPSVTILNVDVPNDGRYVVAYDVTETVPGKVWHYEYAIYNINSHRSGEKVIIPVPSGVNVTDMEFKDIDYHTQTLLPASLQVDNVNWNATRNSSDVTWNTSAYTGTTASGGNENTANAHRWGTTYNYRFDADTGPVDALATLDLFRPGTPDSVTFTVKAPGGAPAGCDEDLDGDNDVDGIDLGILLGAWGPCKCPADIDGDGDVDGFDLALLLAAWGPC